MKDPHVNKYFELCDKFRVASFAEKRLLFQEFKKLLEEMEKTDNYGNGLRVVK
jgi:hypothetical protein